MSKSFLITSMMFTIAFATAWAASFKAPGTGYHGWWRDFRLTDQSRVGIRGFDGTLVFWQVWKAGKPGSYFLVRGWGLIRLVSGYG